MIRSPKHGSLKVHTECIENLMFEYHSTFKEYLLRTCTRKKISNVKSHRLDIFMCTFLYI